MKRKNELDLHAEYLNIGRKAMWLNEIVSLRKRLIQTVFLFSIVSQLNHFIA